MQSYISHPRGTVCNPLIILLSLSCYIDLLRKLSEIVENMIYPLIFVPRKNDISVIYGKSRKYDLTLSVLTKTLFFMQ